MKIYLILFTPLPSIGAPYVHTGCGFFHSSEGAQAYCDRENAGVSGNYGTATVLEVTENNR